MWQWPKGGTEKRTLGNTICHSHSLAADETSTQREWHKSNYKNPIEAILFHYKYSQSHKKLVEHGTIFDKLEDVWTCCLQMMPVPCYGNNCISTHCQLDIPNKNWWSAYILFLHACSWSCGSIGVGVWHRVGMRPRGRCEARCQCVMQGSVCGAVV